MDVQLESIIQYLDGEMNASERLDFEKLIESDEALAKEVAFQRGLHGFLDRREPALEVELGNLGDEFILNPTEKKRGFSVWWSIPILLLVGTLLYFVLSNKGTERNANENTSVEQSEETQPSDNNEEATTPIEVEEENTIPAEETDEPQRIPTDQPIASTDQSAYKRNPTMESIIQDTYRNSDSKKVIQLNQPKPDAKYKFNDKISFKVNGTTNLQADYRLIIYSNRSFDINNDYPVLDTLTSGKKVNNEYQIDFASSLSLNKGLYYLIIRKENSREVLHISRFTVE